MLRPGNRCSAKVCNCHGRARTTRIGFIRSLRERDVGVDTCLTRCCGARAPSPVVEAFQMLSVVLSVVGKHLRIRGSELYMLLLAGALASCGGDTTRPLEPSLPPLVPPATDVRFKNVGNATTDLPI